MKQASVGSSFAVFTVTMMLVVLLALGVYASNRLLTYWLLAQSVDQTIAQLPAAVERAGLMPEIEQMIAARIPATTGLRLARQEAEDVVGHPPAAKVPNEISHQLEAAVLDTLKPSQILASQFISSVNLHNDPGLMDRLHAEFNADPGRVGKGISRRAFRAALAKLEREPAPFIVVDMTWWGELNSNAIVMFPVIPDADAGPAAAAGGLILLTDLSAVIQQLTVITRITSAVISVLCAVSVLFAGILLWMRFHDQVRTNRDIAFLAHHDALTGLPNRAVFNARLTEGLRLAHAKASNLGVMLIDVDKFKEINDTHGHATGDIFLQILAERLKSVFADHLVARLSGDEFAVMTSTISDVARLTRLASEVIAATGHPCVIDGKEIKISLSVGIARANDGSWRASRLLHCADLALYRAKHSGRSTYAWYTPEMDAEAQKRREIEDGLVKALKFNQFELLFQPQYSLVDNQLKGYESLIRWEHPTKGSISPDVFIPIAEETGLIEAIGDWVLERACQEAASWPNKALRVAVNVSGAQFMAGETETKIANALRETGLEPSRLEIEITESLLISNTDSVVETLNKIRAMGVSIMDDFGTGYSSLSYLSRFPFDKIKIDRSFIHVLGRDNSTDAIVTSIIGLGRSLNILITAEGVENPEQVTLLRAAGCDMVQGYLYGKPDTVENHDDLRVTREQQTSTPQRGRPAALVPEIPADEDPAPKASGTGDSQPADPQESRGDPTEPSDGSGPSSTGFVIPVAAAQRG